MNNKLIKVHIRITSQSLSIHNGIESLVAPGWGVMPTIRGLNWDLSTINSFYNNTDDYYVSPHLDINFFEKMCNFRCIYCCNNYGKSDVVNLKGRVSNLTESEIMSAIEQFASHNGKTILLCSDTEPLRPSGMFLNLARHAKANNIRITTYSNMSYITPKYADELRKNDVSIIAKLESFDPTTNNRILGVSGKTIYKYNTYAGERIPQQLNNLLSAGYKDSGLLALSTMITPLNTNDLHPITSFAYDEIGAAHFRKFLYQWGKADQNSELLFLSDIKRRLIYNAILEQDQHYGFQYPSLNENESQSSIDSRIFLNNFFSNRRLPFRLFGHHAGGHYFSFLSSIKPEFGFDKGVRIGFRNSDNEIDMLRYFRTISSLIHQAHNRNLTRQNITKGND
jgi:pyruvate-formate lyase-activating enzyme